MAEAERMSTVEALRLADRASCGQTVARQDLIDAATALARAYRLQTLGIDYDPSGQRRRPGGTFAALRPRPRQ